MAVAAQVVSCQIHQHHMLGILLRVVAQILGILAVGLGIASTLGGSCDGVDVCASAFNTAMCLGARAEDTEPAEVEVEQIGAGIDAAQCTVELEVVPLIALPEAAGQHNLKHIAPHAVGYTTTYILAMLVIGKRTPEIANGSEIVCLVRAVVNVTLQNIQVIFFAIDQHFYKCELVAEMVENNDILV